MALASPGCARESLHQGGAGGQLGSQTAVVDADASDAAIEGGGIEGGSPRAGAAVTRAGAATSPPITLAGTGLCEASGWCWQNPLPQGRPTAALVAASADEIWMATDELGVLLRRSHGCAVSSRPKSGWWNVR
jgi:hypothetical protein